MRLMKSIRHEAGEPHLEPNFPQSSVEWGLERLQCEWCVSPTGTVIFVVHVDDIISAASSADEKTKFRDFLKSKWETSELGEPKFALASRHRHRATAPTAPSHTRKHSKLTTSLTSMARKMRVPSVPLW
jgi:hypothetical protein